MALELARISINNMGRGRETYNAVQTFVEVCSAASEDGRRNHGNAVSGSRMPGGFCGMLWTSSSPRRCNPPWIGSWRSCTGGPAYPIGRAAMAGRVAAP